MPTNAASAQYEKAAPVTAGEAAGKLAAIVRLEDAGNAISGLTIVIEGLREISERGAAMTGAVIKFLIGCVVREHRIGQIYAATPEAEAIEQAARSVRLAIQTLRRQEASLNLRAARERKKETPKQSARLVEKHMQHIFAREDEDRAATMAGMLAARASSRLLKKSFATALQDRIVAVVEGQLDLDCAVVFEFGRT